MSRSSSLFTLAISVLALTLAGCGGKKVKTAKPAKPVRIGHTETGIASWYGVPYHGRRAANGEVYDMEQLTAAHRKLPFETWVNVRNLSNGKNVQVRIQDRGPFVGNRIIDLSRAAARQIDMIGPGTAKVKLTVIKPPKNAPKPMPATAATPAPKAAPAPPPPAPAPAPAAAPTKRRDLELFAVQVGAFRDRSRAERLRDEMKSRYGSARIVERAADTVIYRVLVGEEEDETKAAALAERIRSAGGTAMVVRIDTF